MLARGSVVRFFVVLMSCYVLLSVAWPGVQGAYSAYFRIVVDSIFGTRHARYSLAVERSSSGGGRSLGAFDVQLRAVNRDAGRWAALELNSGLTGYQPTACIIALVLATPIPWRRRWKSLVFGNILVHLFIVARVGVCYFCLYKSASPGAPPIWGQIVDIAAESPVMTFAVPAMIWAIVTLRRGDFAASRRKTDRFG